MTRPYAGHEEIDMLEGCKNARERWGGVHKLIDNWLNARQELIVQYCNLLASKPLAADYALGQQVQDFCQSMMDYCSTGHFEIYEQLIREAKEFDDGGLELARQLVPKLDALTGRCVDFNDSYDERCGFEQLAQLPAALSAIGEVLEDRFELEDQLIARLHTIHRELVTGYPPSGRQRRWPVALSGSVFMRFIVVSALLSSLFLLTGCDDAKAPQSLTRVALQGAHSQSFSPDGR